MEIPHAKVLISSFYRGFSIAGLHGISGRDEQCLGDQRDSPLDPAGLKCRSWRREYHGFLRVSPAPAA
jgi:hypothetical protein